LKKHLYQLSLMVEIVYSNCIASELSHPIHRVSNE
jgi:hypothetical protein